MLGDDDFFEAGMYINTIIFKSHTNSEDQMGLAVDKPGNLIDIQNGEIKSPPKATGAEGNFCISGVTEVDDNFYRIIDIDAIRRKFIPGSDSISGNSSFGGTEND